MASKPCARRWPCDSHHSRAGVLAGFVLFMNCVA
jgi:hypothetical protein